MGINIAYNPSAGTVAGLVRVKFSAFGQESRPLFLETTQD